MKNLYRRYGVKEKSSLQLDLRRKVRLLGEVARAEVRLSKFLGKLKNVGPQRVAGFCRRLNVSPRLPLGALNASQLESLEKLVERAPYAVGKYWEKEMRRKLQSDYALGLRKMKRLRRGLPARGQKTKRNRRSCRRSHRRGLLLRRRS